MKKLIALLLALSMALSMGVVAFAVGDFYDEDFDPATDFEVVFDGEAAPGDAIIISGYEKSDYKVSYEFTNAEYGFSGAGMVESVKWEKIDGYGVSGASDWCLVITLKENYTMTDAKNLVGCIKLDPKEAGVDNIYLSINAAVNNTSEYISGSRKADDADDVSDALRKNHVMIADEAGYVKFSDGFSLYGLAKVDENEKVQAYTTDPVAEDTMDAIEAYLGEDYDTIVEWYNFKGNGFNNDVAFRYDAYAEDPHYFYRWDGEKFVDLGATFNDDEDVMKYEFTANTKGLIIVTDVEIAAAGAATKNPATGASNITAIVGALAVVSLAAMGAVALKK